MTICDRCGGPLDPDVAHVQHSCDGSYHLCDCAYEWCDCSEVCAGCCKDPDCPLARPDQKPTVETEMNDTDSPYDPDLDTALDDEWGAGLTSDSLVVDRVLAWLDDGARMGFTFDTRRRAMEAAMTIRGLRASMIRDARVRAAMRSGMTELAAQQLTDKLTHRDDLGIALDLLDELIDWFGAPDWSGPIIPDDLARRIAHLMERHRPGPQP